MPTPTSTDKSVLSDEFLEGARLRIYNKVKALAPQHLAPFITSDNFTVDTSSPNGVSIVARLIPRKGLSEDLRAQEYGSGLHATRNFKSKRQTGYGFIRITPKAPKTMLVFYWEKLGKKAYLPQVLHPGIRAYNSGKGYIREAFAQSLPKIKEDLSEDAQKSLKLKIRAVFSRPGGVNK